MNVRFLLNSAALATTIIAAGNATAQTRSVRDTATSYGARLNARGLPADQSANRINSRIENRINSRLALRIERYGLDSTNNPTAAFTAKQDDQSRTAPVIAPPPPADEP